MFRVKVDSNSHFGDDSERLALGAFSTFSEAEQVCRQIVDEFLESAYRPGISFDELFSQYKLFGEDPFIVATDEEDVPDFSASTYARERCVTMCGDPGPASE